MVVAPGPLIEEAPRELAPPSASDEGPTVVPPPSPSDVVPPPSPRDEAPSSAVERPAPRTREVLAALRRLVDPPPHESGCEVVMDDPNASLASALAPFMRAADLRRVNCSPAGEGFLCYVSLVKHTGGEDEEWGVILELQLDAAHAIDPRSIRCDFAG